MMNWEPKWGLLDGTTVSGYSPVESVFPKFSPDPKDLEDIDKKRTAQLNRDRETWQREQLFGFTTRELVDLDAITTRKLKKGDLRNQLHPLLKRKNWEVAPDISHKRNYMYDLDPTYTGEWSAHNDIIWDKIRPSLQIATILLQHATRMPWFAALFSRAEDTREFIDVKRMKEKDKRNSAGWHNEFISFRLQGPLTPELQETMKKRMELLYDLMINKYNFQLGFKDVEEDPWEMSAESSMGITSMEKGRNVVGQSKLYCFVSYGLVMPLLRDDLTDQEILGTQFFLANTLMHEIVHALWRVECRISNPPGPNSDTPEPYFDRDPIAELGFSMEANTWGAIPEPMIIHYISRKGPLGYFISPEFPSAYYGDKTPECILMFPQLKNYTTWYPVKASFFEDIQSSEFWSYQVATFGTKMLHARSITQGGRRTYSHVRILNDVIGIDPQDKILRQTTSVDKINSVRSQLADREMLQQLRSAERKMVALGQKIINNDIWEQDFWTQSQIIKDYVAAVMRELVYPLDGKKDSETMQQHMSRLLKFLQDTTEAHVKAVNSLLLIEADTGAVHTDRHANIVRWNKGCRFFARGIAASGAEMGVDTSDTDWREIFCALEFARQCLCPLRKGTIIENLIGDNENAVLMNALDRIAEAGAGFDAQRNWGLAEVSVRKLLSDVDAGGGCSFFADGAGLIINAMIVGAARVARVEDARRGVLLLRGIEGFYGFMVDTVGEGEEGMRLRRIWKGLLGRWRVVIREWVARGERVWEELEGR